jgi:hypothetical protein
MGKKCTKLEMARRVNRVAEMLVQVIPDRQILQYASETWGLGERQGRELLRRARERIKEDLNIEREDYVCMKLGTLDHIIRKALKADNHGAATGAVRLQCELTGVLGYRKQQ